MRSVELHDEFHAFANGCSHRIVVFRKIANGFINVAAFPYAFTCTHQRAVIEKLIHQFSSLDSVRSHVCKRYRHKLLHHHAIAPAPSVAH